MAGTKTLYAWARPLKIAPFFDHTWVTDYEPASQYTTIDEVIAADQSCWYCWGDFHDDNYRAIGTIDGNEGQSSCIAAPNAEDAHGTIYHYAFNGVCHQLANQVLYSSQTSPHGPLIVSDAKGYRISSFLYKTYGRPDSRWRVLARKCVDVASVLSGMDDFIDHLMSFEAGFMEDPEMDRLLALREDFAAGLRTMSEDQGVMSNPEELAGRINELITQLMSRAADMLGKERYQMIFEHEAYSPAPLVEPHILTGYFERLGGDFRPY